MRILRVITSVDPATGGPAQGLRTSIAAIHDAGVPCDNEVVCLDAPGAPFLSDFRTPTHALGPARGPWASSPALRRWLRENLTRFDAVVIHGLWQHASYAVSREINRLRLLRGSSQSPRFFLMPHGMLDPWFQRDRSRRVKAWRNWAYWKLIEERTVALADAVLFTCQRELELARTSFRPYRPRKEVNVGYGVLEPPLESDRMQRCFLNCAPELGHRPYLLYLSRIHPKKGIDLLVDSFADAAVRRAAEGLATPDLVIAGSHESAYGTSIKRRAEQRMQDLPSSAAKPTIHFTGALSGDAKWGAFYGCEAFVLPSHQENFGIAVVEALACARTVPITDQVNIYTEIEAAGAGLVAPDTGEGVASLLARFFELNHQDREAMSRSALSCYRQNFRPESAAENLLAAVSDGESVLAGTGR